MLTVGIDIGTSYSSISFLDNEGKPQPVRVENGKSIYGDSYSLPSAVYVEDNGDIVIGQLAMSSRFKNPSSFQGEFKRDLGQKIPYHLGPLQLMPEELYKEFFIYFKRMAEEAAGEKIKKAYITYPANFSKRKKELIEDAAKKAGLLEIEMIDEPTAAAYCYCSKGKIKVGDRLLVYDFGGGTFDVALIEYTNQGFKPVTQPLGIDKCGGIDIDMHIFNDIYNSIPADTIGMIKNNRLVINRLKAQIMECSVKIKHQLSSVDSSKEIIPLGFEHMEYALTREKLKGMIAPMVEETLLQVKAIVKNANLTMTDISTCILVGGTSRVPYIRERLEEITGKPVYKDIDPELSVCMGAALWRMLKASTELALEKPINQNTKTPEEQFELGCDYYFGRNGVEIDYTRAVYWFTKAAEQGNAAAQYYLGTCYYDGKGVVKDEKQAVYWYEKAAKQGHVDAQSVLGFIYYYDGEDDLAKIWWEEAAKQGNREAINHLELLEASNWESKKNSGIDNKVFQNKSNTDNKNKYGNSVGNIINEGLIAQQGEWIYYRNESDGGKLYKMRTDGTGRIKLKDNIIRWINIINDWIYYRNESDGGKLYKIYIHGNNSTKLNDDSSEYINVVDDWIYYRNTSNKGRIYKISTSGKNRTQLNDDDSIYINVVGDWIYYSNWTWFKSCRIYRMRSDGTNKIMLNNCHSKYINVIGHWIYYYNFYEDKICKVRTNGTDGIDLNNAVSCHINIIGNWIYYSSGNGLWKIRSDGTGMTKLNDDKCENINIGGDWIYYQNVSDGRKLYKICPDGTGRQIFG